MPTQPHGRPAATVIHDLSAILVYGDRSPEQAISYWQSLQRQEWDMPEKYLLSSLILDAVEFYKGEVAIAPAYSEYSTRHSREINRQRMAAAAAAWLFEDVEEKVDPRFTFRECCDYLGLNVDYWRQELRKLRPAGTLPPPREQSGRRRNRRRFRANYNMTKPLTVSKYERAKDKS